MVNLPKLMNSLLNLDGFYCFIMLWLPALDCILVCETSQCLPYLWHLHLNIFNPSKQQGVKTITLQEFIEFAESKNFSHSSPFVKIDIFKYLYLVTFDRSKQPGEGTTDLQEFIGFAEFDNLSLFKDHDPVII